MNQLMVVIFADQAKLHGAVQALKKQHSERKLYASAVVAKDASGKLSVQEITKEGHGGTAVAALIGALAGLPAGPVAAAIMATGGAVLGNAAELSTEDDFNEFATNIAGNVVPGGAAIVADVTEDGMTAFKTTMQALGGTPLTK